MIGKQVEIVVGIHKGKFGKVVRMMMEDVLEVELSRGHFVYVLSNDTRVVD